MPAPSIAIILVLPTAPPTLPSLGGSTAWLAASPIASAIVASSAAAVRFDSTAAAAAAAAAQQMAAAPAGKRHVFFTGQPGVGKTTAVLNIVQALARTHDTNAIAHG